MVLSTADALHLLFGSWLSEPCQSACNLFCHSASAWPGLFSFPVTSNPNTLDDLWNLLQVKTHCHSFACVHLLSLCPVVCLLHLYIFYLFHPSFCSYIVLCSWPWKHYIADTRNWRVETPPFSFSHLWLAATGPPTEYRKDKGTRMSDQLDRIRSLGRIKISRKVGGFKFWFRISLEINIFQSFRKTVQLISDPIHIQTRRSLHITNFYAIYFCLADSLLVYITNLSVCALLLLLHGTPLSLSIWALFSPNTFSKSTFL